MFAILSLFACTEYGFHNKINSNLGGDDSQATSDGSGFDFTTDSLIEDDPEYNSLVGRDRPDCCIRDHLQSSYRL